MSVVTVTVLSNGQQMSESYQLLSVDIRRDVNRIPVATLVFVDGDAAEGRFEISDTGTFTPGHEIEIKARYEGAPPDTTLFKGLVVRHGVDAGPHGSRLRVEMKDAAIRLAYGRNSVVFRESTDTDVIKKLLRTAGLKTGTLDATDQKHAELVQYNSTDWDFLVSRADASGLLVAVEDGTVNAMKPRLSAASKLSLEYGRSEVFDAEFEVDAMSQYVSVSSRGWSLKDQKAAASQKVTSSPQPQGNLNGGTLAKSLGFGAYQLSHLVPLLTHELNAWAQATMQRSRLALVRGRISCTGVAKIKLLDMVEISGWGTRFAGKALVTGICHRIQDGTWSTDLQFGLSPQRFCQQQEGIQDLAAAGLLPGVTSLQIGIVADFAEDPDKQFRVKVTLPGLDEAGAVVWARLASPDSGNGRGLFFRPEPGDEVIVAFFNGDPRQPVILGALHSGKNAPPSDFGKLTKKNPLKGIVTRGGTRIAFNDGDKASLTIETKDKNVILLDDDKAMISLADKHGNKITMDKDGITLVSAKDLNLEASGNVVIKGAKVDIK
jgi:Rhs element Vgr protein